MRTLWFCFLLHTAIYAEASFGEPFLHNSPICRPWNCISAKLGLSNSLPPRDDFSATLKSLLPPGPWQEVVVRVLDTCYNDRQRNYISTCPGQAVLHCTVDNLIENCPEEHRRKDDGCYPLSTLAGLKDMFAQSRYADLEKNLLKEKRPAWFMKNYFSSKCCNVPEIINSTIRKECGFDKFIKYYDRVPTANSKFTYIMKQASTTHKPTSIRVVDFSEMERTEKHVKSNGQSLKDKPATLDPLQCCDMSDFISQSMRDRTGFQPTWDSKKRLVLETGPIMPVSTTVSPTRVLNKDIKVVPLSCETNTCIFKKLNIITDSNTVDMLAFSKFLDNFTSSFPDFAKAKARVITQCIARDKNGYEADCEINKVMACTLDVLSENCPYATKTDICRNSRRNNTICQISSSMYRPKHRRTGCGIPSLVDQSVLTACGAVTLSRPETVADPPVYIPGSWVRSFYECKDNVPVTTALMREMGVLNKYGFMDHFRMQDKLRAEPLANVLASALANTPKYSEYCGSARKLLNVLDTMLSTCPISKRKNTTDCNALYNEINPPESLTRDKLLQALQNYNHKFFSTPSPIRETTVTYRTNPLFDFGLLKSNNVPPVQTIDLKAKPIPVLLPVYMRLRSDPLKVDPQNQNGGRTVPYLLQRKVQTTNSVPLLIPPGLP